MASQVLAACCNYNRQPSSGSFDDQLGARLGSIEQLLGSNADNPAAPEAEGSDPEGEDETPKTSPSKAGKTWDREVAVLRSRRKCKQDCADLKDKLNELAAKLDNMLKERDELDPSEQKIYEDEFKVLVSKKNALDLVRNNNSEALTQYLESFSGASKNVAPGKDGKFSIGSLPPSSSYRRLSVVSSLDLLLEEFDTIDSQTALKSLEKRIQRKCMPLKELDASCRLSATECQNAMKMVKTREAKRESKRKQEDKEQNRAACSDRLKRCKMSDPEKSLIFINKNVKQVRTIACPEDFVTMKPQPSRPLLLKKACCPDLWKATTTDEKLKKFFDDQLKSFGTNLKTPGSAKAGGRQLTPEQIAEVGSFQELLGAAVRPFSGLLCSMPADDTHGDFLSKAAALSQWCMAGGNEEFMTSEYGFMAALRYQAHGKRDVVLTNCTQLVPWVSASRDASSAKDLASLRESQVEFKKMTDTQMHEYLKDPASWAEQATVEAGDILYVPAGAVSAARTSSDHVVGLRLGVLQSSDTLAPGALHKLKAWSQTWYGSNFTEHLGKTFDTLSQAHKTKESAASAN